MFIQEIARTSEKAGNIMKKFRMLNSILKGSGITPILVSLISLMFVGAFLLFLVEPEITSYGDALWLCFTTVTTIGYGDFYATTTLGRLISVILSMYGIIMIAMITGVSVNYFSEVRKLTSNEEVKRLMISLENLEGLNRKELKEVSILSKKYSNEIQGLTNRDEVRALFIKLERLEELEASEISKLAKEIKDREVRF